MIFKKKTPTITPQTQSQNSDNSASNAVSSNEVSSNSSAKPLYQKPVLRRYDQIEQVKPYGPSEL